MLRPHLFALLMLSCISAARADTVIGLQLATLHEHSGYVNGSGRTVPYRGQTPGLYVRMPDGFTAGAYRNSCGTGAAYLGYTLETRRHLFGLTVGAIHGAVPGSRVMPLIVPSMRLPLGQHLALRVIAVPRKPRVSQSSAAITAAIEASF